MIDTGGESPPNGLKTGKNGSFYTGSESRYLRGFSEGLAKGFAPYLRRICDGHSASAIAVD